MAVANFMSIENLSAFETIIYSHRAPEFNVRSGDLKPSDLEIQKIDRGGKQVLIFRIQPSNQGYDFHSMVSEAVGISSFSSDEMTSGEADSFIFKMKKLRKIDATFSESAEEGLDLYVDGNGNACRSFIKPYSELKFLGMSFRAYPKGLAAPGTQYGDICQIRKDFINRLKEFN